MRCGRVAEVVPVLEIRPSPGYEPAATAVIDACPCAAELTDADFFDGPGQWERIELEFREGGLQASRAASGPDRVKTAVNKLMSLEAVPPGGGIADGVRFLSDGERVRRRKRGFGRRSTSSRRRTTTRPSPRRFSTA